MRLDTFFEARDLYDKYQLCERVMEYLSDDESVKGQKYLETLKQFADAFKMEFMMFVHERMEDVGMQFEDLHCPEHSEQPDTPEPPTEPKDQKFAYGEKVEITNGDYKGKNGMVMGFDDTNATYYVVSPQFSMWFAESALKAYVEESEENSEEPTMKFKVDDIVKILSGESEGKMAKVVYCDASDNSYRVEFLDNGATGSMWYQENDLELYTNPENPEEK